MEHKNRYASKYIIWYITSILLLMGKGIATTLYIRLKSAISACVFGLDFSTCTTNTLVRI